MNILLDILTENTGPVESKRRRIIRSLKKCFYECIKCKAAIIFEEYFCLKNNNFSIKYAKCKNIKIHGVLSENWLHSR